MHRRLPRCDTRRFQKRKQSSVENTQVQSIHRDGICLVHTHQNLFAKPFVQDILMSFPGPGHAYHSQVFWSPNLLNGEQLTCSKAACEGGGTVLRFNCPQKMQSLLNLWHGLYSHSYLGKVSGPPLGIVVCLTSGQNVLTKCIIPDSCCDMYIFSSQLQRESKFLIHPLGNEGNRTPGHLHMLTIAPGQRCQVWGRAPTILKS